MTWKKSRDCPGLENNSKILPESHWWRHMPGASRIFSICHRWLRQAKLPYQSYKKKNDETAWMVSMIPVSAILSLRWPRVQSRSSKVTRSGKVKRKILDLGVVVRILGQFLVNIAKDVPTTLFELLISDKFWKSRKCRGSREIVWISLLTFKTAKLNYFSILVLIIVYIFIDKWFVTYIPVFSLTGKKFVFLNRSFDD